MRTIGSYEAKTHLPRLLGEVSRGETITITKHGMPVAKLVPIEDSEEMRTGINPLDGTSVREMIEEARQQTGLTNELVALRHELGESVRRLEEGQEALHSDLAAVLELLSR